MEISGSYMLQLSNNRRIRSKLCTCTHNFVAIILVAHATKCCMCLAVGIFHWVNSYIRCKQAPPCIQRRSYRQAHAPHSLLSQFTHHALWLKGYGGVTITHVLPLAAHFGHISDWALAMQTEPHSLRSHDRIRTCSQATFLLWMTQYDAADAVYTMAVIASKLAKGYSSCYS